MEWEKIDEYTARAKVHKGWLVRVLTEVTNEFIETQVSICFVPDPLHAWTL